MTSSSRKLIIILAIMFGGFGLLFMFAGFSILGEEGSKGDGILFASVGGISSAIGFTPLILFIRQKIIKNRVLSRGVMIQSELLDVTYASYAVNGVRPYLIRSQWVDQSSNKLYLFKSEPFVDNPESVLKKGSKVPVYINPENPKQYYMDIQSISALKRFYKR
ncbi:DUF3592 domain-containing protein [Ignatzschineria rhizosphaerae]|uniref:DUF3592 domain-containing protein n=1 Tax=Ignatzschineria rhizosphaerae TaxID=2923279 RepID=A0ABY3XBG5_9GAMM|nr:DUF3592 domain-containing protein [Ignatzschineria rhizosphaerae]UNM97293.1 DUF3592 domain-containing protein [Ignatzschineria rhizosphaerae]